jgi:hypothetical protein
MWVVEVDPEVSMSLWWWKVVIQGQAPCNPGWYVLCTYTQRPDGLAKLGGVAALPHKVSLNFSR